jgi:hypothetical protein
MCIRRMLQPLSCRLRLLKKITAQAYGGPAEGKRLTVCLGRWGALQLRGPPRRRTVQRPHLREIGSLF